MREMRRQVAHEGRVRRPPPRCHVTACPVRPVRAFGAMTAKDQLTAVVRILAPIADVRPGIAGMVLVNGVPVLRVNNDRLVLLPIVVGLNRIDARTVGPGEDPLRIASEVLDRRGVLQAA